LSNFVLYFLIFNSQTIIILSIKNLNIKKVKIFVLGYHHVVLNDITQTNLIEKTGFALVFFFYNFFVLTIISKIIGNFSKSTNTSNLLSETTFKFENSIFSTLKYILINVYKKAYHC